MANLRLYYKSDYKIRETFKTQAGEIIDPREYNFSFTFIAGKENTYTCSHVIGGGKNEWVNCVYDSVNNAVLCMLDNHNLLPGRLKRELTIEEPDSDFPDNKLDYITFKEYEIELIDTTDGDILYNIIDEEVIISGTTVTLAQLATIIHDSTEKETINDNDEVPYLDSETEYGIVKTTWLNIKSKLKAYFDTIFEPKNSNIQSHISDTGIHVTSVDKSNFHSHSNKSDLDNVSGSNTGDETAQTIKNKLGITTLSGSNTGDQSASNFDIKDLTDSTNLRNTWSGKQDALSADVDYLTPTTASTTYEPKKGENDNYVTDDEKTVIENTSGANTGDETAESIIDKIGTDGQIKSDYLPSYVDDVIEGYYFGAAFYSDSAHTELITAEQGKIYVDIPTNFLYRYSGSAYISISVSRLDPVQVTYEELYALKQSNNLTPNQVYLITDYATTYNINPYEYDILTGSVEPLLVTAKSANELHLEAKSKIYPLDTVFYNIENSLNSLKGRIYRRIDNEKNIDVDIDFRTVKVRRGQTTATAWNSEINYGKGDIVLYNGSFYLSLKNNNLNNITSKYWAKLNLPNLSYASFRWNGAVLDAVAGGVPQFGFITTGLKEDLQIFGDYENSYNIKITGFNNTIFHSSVRNFECNNLKDSYFYGSIDGFKMIDGEYDQFVFFGNHIKNSVSLKSFSNIYNGDIINSTINNSQGVFTSDLVDATFINDYEGVNLFTGLVKNVTFKDTSSLGANFIYGKFTNVYAESASEFVYNVFNNDVDNVIFKGVFYENTCNAKLSNITFDGDIKLVTFPYGEINGGTIKGTIGGYSSPVDLSSLVLPAVPCRMDTIDSTPLTFKFTYLNDVGRTAYMIVGLDASVIETGVYETETNKESDIETYKESTTKYPTLKGLYDWAVGKFVQLSQIVTSWSATPTHDNIPSEKLVEDSLALKADIAPANGSTSALRALFIARGYDSYTNTYNCVYNTNTGYYEMNELTDITEAEMSVIYNYSTSLNNINLRAALSRVKCRTFYPLKPMLNSDSNLTYICQSNDVLETFFVSLSSFIGEMGGAFDGCVNLKTVNALRIRFITTAANVLNAFNGCQKLEECYLHEVAIAISFAWSPLLSLASLQCLVTNRLNGTTRITITVHPTVWAKLNDSTNYPEWNALLVDAVNNQYIDFASA